MGIVDPLLSCLRSFLQNRFQRVIVGNSFSSYLPISSGVPQGSVLGPLLFLLYINDVSSLFQHDCSCTEKLFADDLKVYSHVDLSATPHEFQAALNRLCNWAETWQLKFSVSKWNSFIITNSLTNVSQLLLSLADAPLSQVSVIRDLGVLVNDKLVFTPHITTIVAKARQRLFLLFKCFTTKNHKLLLLAYKTYILPILEYCSSIWSPHKLSDIDLLENVQRSFTKRLSGLWDLPYDARLQRTGLHNWSAQCNVHLQNVYQGYGIYHTMPGYKELVCTAWNCVAFTVTWRCATR